MTNTGGSGIIGDGDSATVAASDTYTCTASPEVVELRMYYYSLSIPEDDYE
jgi:hypothetical protein